MPKSLIKAVYLVATTLFLSLVAPLSAYAAEFKLNPSTGNLIKGETFIIDILIDSEGDELSQAAAVLSFDPDLIQIVKAQRNNSLFETFPSSEQSTDNTNGVLMLTGFTQSGTADLYKTDGDPDVFARITFEAIDSGNLTINWEYSGDIETFYTSLVTDGSPPQNILTTKPIGGTYTIKSASDIPSTPTTPTTGITEFDGAYVGGAVFAGGILLTIGMVVYYKASDRIISSDRKTIVLTED